MEYSRWFDLCTNRAHFVNIPRWTSLPVSGPAFGLTSYDGRLPLLLMMSHQVRGRPRSASSRQNWVWMSSMMCQAFEYRVMVTTTTCPDTKADKRFGKTACRPLKNGRGWPSLPLLCQESPLWASSIIVSLNSVWPKSLHDKICELHWRIEQYINEGILANAL